MMCTELAERIAQLFLDSKVIVASGYAELPKAPDPMFALQNHLVKGS